MTGNEILSKIYFEKLFFQNGLAFFDLFYSYHYIRYFIYSDCMCVQYIQKQPPEVLFKKGVLENFAYLTGKHLCWFFPVKLATFLRTPNFEEHLRTTADQMIYNKILLEKIRAVFRISIKFNLNVRKTGWKKIRFQLALNKTYSLTPPPLIHRRFKHHQRTKINKTILSASSVLYAKFTISVMKST